tara:strand:- start:9085 stop:9228 length:144 start_codon:yes stop_codon:yes gene_type:complete
VTRGGEFDLFQGWFALAGSSVGCRHRVIVAEVLEFASPSRAHDLAGQ